MTSPIPSAPFETSDLMHDSNDEAIEQYLTLLGDYRIHYQDLPLQIPSLAHPHQTQAGIFDDEDSGCSESTTTLSLHTVPFSVTSMVAALHPPFTAITPQMGIDGSLDDIGMCTKYSSRRTIMEITPSTVAETPIASTVRQSASPSTTGDGPMEPCDSAVHSGSSRTSHLDANHSGHAASIDTPQRKHQELNEDLSTYSERAVASLAELVDPMGYHAQIQKSPEAARILSNRNSPRSPSANPLVYAEENDSVGPADKESSPILTPTRSVSSTSEYRACTSIPIPRWVRVPPANEHRALQQRVLSAERSVRDLHAQTTAAHILVDALWEIVMDQQQKLSDALDPKGISTTYKDIYYIHAASEQLQSMNRCVGWVLPLAAVSSIVSVFYYGELWQMLSSVLLLILYNAPTLQYSHSLD